MESIAEKRCSSCKAVKPLSSFGIHRRTKDGLNYYCVECKRKKNRVTKRDPEKLRKKWRDYANKYPERIRAKKQKRYRELPPEQKRATRLQGKYGLSLAGYDSLFEKQNGLCAICGCQPTGENLCVDHDHATGKVRGLLCRLCNSLLGRFSDDETRFMRVIEYLQASR